MGPLRRGWIDLPTTHHLYVLVDGGWEDGSWIRWLEEDEEEPGPYIEHTQVHVWSTRGFTFLGTASYGGGPLAYEVWDAPPADDADDWEAVAEIDMRVESGRLAVLACLFEEGVDLGEVRHALVRVRLAGRGLESASDVDRGGDRYRVQVWPSRPARADGP